MAGGIEMMSAVPIGGNMYHPDPDLIEQNPSAYISMGLTAENVSVAYGVSRAEQDAFSAESHRRALHAIETHQFESQIIPIDAERMGVDEKGKPVITPFKFTMDEGVRAGVTVESLSKLKTIFKRDGTVTAGNASQMSDGAAFVLLMSKEKAASLGLKPIAKFVSFAVAGVDPKIMGIGPIKAIPKVLKIADLKLDDIELIELNEAFASQSIACINTLGLNREIVNVNGGAIALGHPLGCTGAYLTIKLLSEMEKRQQHYGLVSMCIGGGMGAAAIFERCND